MLEVIVCSVGGGYHIDFDNKIVGCSYGRSKKDKV